MINVCIKKGLYNENFSKHRQFIRFYYILISKYDNISYLIHRNHQNLYLFHELFNSRYRNYPNIGV